MRNYVCSKGPERRGISWNLASSNQQLVCRIRSTECHISFEAPATYQSHLYSHQSHMSLGSPYISNNGHPPSLKNSSPSKYRGAVSLSVCTEPSKFSHQCQLFQPRALFSTDQHTPVRPGTTQDTPRPPH